MDMNKFTKIGIVLTIVLFFAVLTGCSAVEQRLADGTAVAEGRSVDSPFSQEDGSGGGDDEDAAEDVPTATATPQMAADSPTETMDPIILGTMIRATVNAKASQTVAAMDQEEETPTPSETAEDEDATPTLSDARFTELALTLTAIDNLTTTPQTPTPTATATEEGDQESPTATEGTPEETAVPCNAFRFVAHVTYPPYSTVSPSTSFYKTWQVQNTGTCTWSGDYALVYNGGYQLGGTTPLVLGSGVTVFPGQYVTITIQLFTPPQPGTYDSYWFMQDASGNAFGGGATRSDPLTAIVVVPGVSEPVFTSPASTAPPFYTNTPNP
jgi:hypothetical protein